MTAKVDDPMMKREQFATDLRKTLKQEKLSKKRHPQGQFQELEPGAPELEMQEEQENAEQDYFELPEQVDALDFEDL
jgi:hypothetical protein